MSRFRNYIAGAMLKKLKPSSNTKGFIDLTKVIKDEVSGYGVALHDPCCPADPTKRPVWFNITVGKLQYLGVDGVTVVNLTYTIPSSLTAPETSVETPESTETPS